MRIKGPVVLVFSRNFPICADMSMKAILIPRASVMQISVIKVPCIEAKEIAAVIVPGPAIKGAASGTIDMSAIFCASFSS